VTTQRRRPRTYSSPACYLHEFGPAHKVAPIGDIQIKRIYDEPRRNHAVVLRDVLRRP
jgi:hypothetical protein